MSLYWDLSDVFLGIRLELRVFGRKTQRQREPLTTLRHQGVAVGVGPVSSPFCTDEKLRPGKFCRAPAGRWRRAE